MFDYLTKQRILCVICFIFILSDLAGCVTPRKSFEKGRQFANEGDWDKSVRFFQEAQEKDPDNTEIKLMLIRSKKNASIAHSNMGEALLKAKLYNEAIAEFQLSIAFNPSNRKAGDFIQKAKTLKEAAHYLKQAQNFLRAKKYNQARETLQNAVKLDPENKEALKLLNYYKKKEGEPLGFKLKLRSDNPVSLKFKKAPIIDVFEILTKLSGINFIFDKDMKESKVTLFITDVSFNKFLEILLKTHSLAAKPVSEKTIIVYPNTTNKIKEYQDLQIRTFYMSHVESKKMVGILSKILKSRNITANEKINSIVIRGSREEVELASKIIDANDRAQAEVMLNVEILEVKQSLKKQLGIDFSESLKIGIGEKNTEVDGDASILGESVAASFHTLASISNKELMLSLPTATLKLLKKDADTRTLANPQIRVKNAEKANIHIGNRIPLRTNRRVDSSTGDITYDYQYQSIGIKLDVEPTINMHDEILVKVGLEVSSLGDNVGTTDDVQYEIKTRKANSVLTVFDGESIIIGGLINNEELETIRKIPMLGDMPYLGQLFTSQDKDDSKTDIIMSITPIVTRSQEIPDSDVTTIWSGREKNFSLKEPYESYIKRKSAYHEYPNEKFFTDTDHALNNKNPVNNNPDTEQLPSAEKDNFKNLWPVSLPYSIHVNSLPRKELADKRVNDLIQMNYESFMIPVSIPDQGVIYRIFVGRFKGFTPATNLCQELKNKKEFEEDIHVVDRKWAFGE
ncbi:SPOR domain-containing protein [Candidatus Magnetomoraceae bacterium gMMP-15]